MLFFYRVIYEGFLEKVTFILISEGSERAGHAFISGGIWKEKTECPVMKFQSCFKFKMLIKHPARAARKGVR